MANKRVTIGYRIANGYRRSQDPYIKFGKRWRREYGFDAGDTFDLVRIGNMLIFVKVSSNQQKII